MDTQTQTSGFSDVLHDLHLRAVIANSINVEPFLRRFDVGGNAVVAQFHEQVLTAFDQVTLGTGEGVLEILE